MKCVEGEWESGLHGMPGPLLGLGVCIQLNPWRRLGQNNGKSGHKLKVLAGRRESVERQLCDYLTVRLEFSSLFSLHTLRASLKYCSSPTHPRWLFLFFLWSTVVSSLLSPWHTYVFMCVCVCVYMQIDGFCLSLESFHAARAQCTEPKLANPLKILFNF